MDEQPIPATLYPSDESSVPVSNRRQNERHLTLFRVGALLVGDQRELCVVKNVSSRGAQIRAYCDLREGNKVSLELKEQQPISGEVSWVDGTDAGIEFDEQIDVLALLKVGSDGPQPRMPRVEVRTPGLVRQGAVVHRVTVSNISQGGIGAECSAELEVGGEVTVTLTGLAPQRAVVRWGRSGVYGITFNTVLGLPLLVEWLHAQASPGKPSR